MATMNLAKEGSVFVLTMTNGAEQNTMTLDWTEEFLATLDEVAAAEGNAALLVTSNDPKFWSNGINLPWLLSQPSDCFPKLAKKLDDLFVRIALLDMPTVACLVGHTFAGAAVMSTCFDFRLMREDRGFFCFSEVDVRVPFTPLMHEMIATLADYPTLRELMLTGKRIAGPEALAMKVVSAIYPGDVLPAKAMELAEFLAKKDRATYASIKRGLRKGLVGKVEAEKK
jgi:enoyl-CoA hydratase/carnithine racemase